MNGTIKRLLTDKGFGFIRGENGTEYFFHHSAAPDGNFNDMKEGDNATFDEEPRSKKDKGPRACNVRLR